MPGYKATFLQELQRRHQCRICSLALRVPMQTECGHLFCKDCVEPVFLESQPLCPVDREPISREDVCCVIKCHFQKLIMNWHCADVGKGIPLGNPHQKCE